MNKKEAISALENGAIMTYMSPRNGMSANAFINQQKIRIDTARKLMSTILKMNKKSSSISYWSLKTTGND
jgi:hypothetical protein